jgi:hypothetical protein
MRRKKSSSFLYLSLHLSTHSAMTIGNPQGISPVCECQNKVRKMKRIKSIKYTVQISVTLDRQLPVLDGRALTVGFSPSGRLRAPTLLRTNRSAYCSSSQVVRPSSWPSWTAAAPEHPCSLSSKLLKRWARMSATVSTPPPPNEPNRTASISNSCYEGLHPPIARVGHFRYELSWI